MSDILSALKEIHSEIGIDVDAIKDSISKAILAVCKNTYGIEDPVIDFNPSGELTVKVKKTVCEKVEDEMIQISLDDALKLNSDAKLGDLLEDFVDTKQFGRIAAQTVRSVVRQGIRDGEKAVVTQKLKCYEKEIVSAQIVRINRKSEIVILKIGEIETTLPRYDSKFLGKRKEGDFIKVYVVRIETDGLIPVPVVSRSCAELVRKLFESEVPEISQGIVSIQSIAREAGLRTKVAVSSNDPAVDPVGACIGNNRSRIRTIINEIDGEKIDVINYYDDPVEYIEAAIAPARVVEVQVNSESDNTRKECSVTVPDDQLSLAIGQKGQNVRLASRLTGWKISLRPESGYYGE